MKKIALLVAVLIGGAVVALADSYLYWQVNTSDAGLNGFTTTGDTTSETYYNTIHLQAYDSDGKASGDYLTLWSSSWDNFGTGLTDQNLTAALSGAEFYATLDAAGAVGGLSYAVELFNDSSIVAQSDYLSASSVGSYTYTTTTESPIAPLTTPWTAGGFHAVPEPNSAMLLMLGLAGLALRRRREVKA